MPSDPTDQDLERAREWFQHSGKPLGSREWIESLATLLADTRERCAVKIDALALGLAQKSVSMTNPPGVAAIFIELTELVQERAAAIRGSK